MVKSVDCRAKDPSRCRYHGVVLRAEEALRAGDTVRYFGLMEEARLVDRERPRVVAVGEGKGRFVGFNREFDGGVSFVSVMFGGSGIKGGSFVLDKFERKWLRKFLGSGVGERVKPVHDEGEWRGLSEYYNRFVSDKNFLLDEVEFGETVEEREGASRQLTALVASNILLESHYEFKRTVRENADRVWDYVPDYSIENGVGVRLLGGKGAVLSFTRFGRVVGEVEVSEGFLKDLKKVL